MDHKEHKVIHDVHKDLQLITLSALCENLCVLCVP